MDELEVLARQLRRHTMRRRHGTPTATVLLGEVVSCLEQIERLFEGALGRLLVTPSAPHALLADAWVRSMASTLDLTQLALSVAAGEDRPGDLTARWQARSPAERERWLGQLAEGSARPDVRAAAIWLATFDTKPRQPDEGAEALQALCAWLPAVEWPALCVLVDESQALEELCSLCMLAPALPLVSIVPCEVWREGLAMVSPRARALLLEGLVEAGGRLSVPPTGTARTRTSTPMSSSAPPADPVEALRQRARSAQVLAARAQELGRDDASHAAERARSLAELLLHELLERDPLTRGLFALNALMPFDFGPRRAEIDLVCTQLSLAIEVDGYHHFTGPEAYRRDRRKDVLLQTEGFLVTRCLADDVLERGDEVIAAVRMLVVRRKSELEETRGVM